MKTVLYDKHVELGGKIIDFAGWEMPVQYSGIVDEHQAVRTGVGIFDVSHMGRILIEGPEAGTFLDYVCTNIISTKSEELAIYTVLPSASGGCVDDAIVYKQDNEHYFLIANASNREKDKNHLLEQAARFDVTITDKYDSEGILAIQGPKATELLGRLLPETKELKPMHFVQLDFKGDPLILSFTGYTGAGGFEIYAPNKVICEIWDWCMEQGKGFNIKPIGLGARDTLRMEMGFALYGHELSDEIAPNESVSSWTIRWNKPDFLGKAAMQRLEENGNKRSEHGVILQDKGVAREGYEVLQNGNPIGTVTSGTHSPSLNKAIAIVLVDQKLNPGDEVEVQIRNRKVKAEVVKFPFLS